MHNLLQILRLRVDSRAKFRWRGWTNRKLGRSTSKSARPRTLGNHRITRHLSHRIQRLWRNQMITQSQHNLRLKALIQITRGILTKRLRKLQFVACLPSPSPSQSTTRPSFCTALWLFGMINFLASLSSSHAYLLFKTSWWPISRYDTSGSASLSSGSWTVI